MYLIFVKKYINVSSTAVSLNFGILRGAADLFIYVEWSKKPVSAQILTVLKNVDPVKFDEL